jgi:hypothetical protein
MTAALDHVEQCQLANWLDDPLPRTVLRSNAPVQLRRIQLRARGAAARNPWLLRQLQRSLGVMWRVRPPRT